MQPHKSISTTIFKVICGIYGWKRNNEYLYIGMSLNIFKRLSTHSVVGIIEDFKDDDKIDIWYCKREELCNLETKLIEHFKPKYNKTNPLNTYRIRHGQIGKQLLFICEWCKEEYLGRSDGSVFCSEKCLKEYIEIKRKRSKKTEKKFDELGNQICPFCNKLVNGRSNKIYCSDKCKVDYWMMYHPRNEVEF